MVAIRMRRRRRRRRRRRIYNGLVKLLVY